MPDAISELPPVGSGRQDWDLTANIQARLPTRELILRACELSVGPEAGLLDDPLATVEGLARGYAMLLTQMFGDAAVSTLEQTIEIVAASDAHDDIVYLRGYDTFFAACVRELGQSSSVRLTLVGPTYLLPTWWMKRRESHGASAVFSRALADRVRERTLHPCEIIHRNDRIRFSANLAEYVTDRSEWNQLVDDMLAQSYVISGDVGATGPRFRCVDPGFSHLPHIFDHTVLIGTRLGPNERLSGGWKLSQRNAVALERDRWSSLFFHGQMTQADELARIREFLSSLDWPGLDGSNGK